MLVSQFTLYHQLKGSKPDFHGAMNGELAKPLYDLFLEKLEKAYGKDDKIFPGAFGQYMNIETVCDGPVTITIDSIKEPKAVQKWEKEQAKKAKILKLREEKEAAKIMEKLNLSNQNVSE